MNRLEQQINFIQEIEKLKTVQRQNLTLDNLRPENSAEHSWHVALMSMILMETAEGNTVDQLKVMKMLLIHDLVEIYAGDAFLYDDHARASAQDKEAMALQRLVSILPKDQADELHGLWQEFETCESDEAKFADSLDALQPLINHLVTAPRDHNPHQLHVEKVYQKKEKVRVHTPKLWSIVEEMIKKSVEKGLYKDTDKS